MLTSIGVIIHRQCLGPTALTVHVIVTLSTFGTHLSSSSNIIVVFRNITQFPLHASNGAHLPIDDCIFFAELPSNNLLLVSQFSFYGSQCSQYRSQLLLTTPSFHLVVKQTEISSSFKRICFASLRFWFRAGAVGCLFMGNL